MTTNTRRRRITLQAAAIAGGATASAVLYAAVEHTDLLITGLLGVCIAGLLGCMTTAIHITNRTRPQPTITMRVLPTAPPPDAPAIPPAPTIQPALPAATPRRRPSPRPHRPADTPATWAGIR